MRCSEGFVDKWFIFEVPGFVDMDLLARTQPKTTLPSKTEICFPFIHVTEYTHPPNPEKEHEHPDLDFGQIILEESRQ